MINKNTIFILRAYKQPIFCQNTICLYLSQHLNEVYVLKMYIYIPENMSSVAILNKLHECNVLRLCLFNLVTMCGNLI